MPEVTEKILRLDEIIHRNDGEVDKRPTWPIGLKCAESEYLIARLPRFSHISTFMAEQLHWLPLSVRIQFKVLILVLKSQLGLAPKYLCHKILRPISATSLRPLRSSDRLDLYVPRVRTTMAQSRSFACIGPSLWNGLSPSLRSIPSSLLSSLPLSLTLKPSFSLGVPRTGSASEGLML